MSASWLYFVPKVALLLSFLLLVVVMPSAWASSTTVSPQQQRQGTPPVKITGRITSCSGCDLHRLKILKEFLKEGGAESYHGVSIEYKSGRKAVLEIFHDDVSVEKIEIQNMESELELHKLFIMKGFLQKSAEEIAQILDLREKEKRQEEQEMIEYRRKQKELRKQRFRERQLREQAEADQGNQQRQKHSNTRDEL